MMKMGAYTEGAMVMILFDSRHPPFRGVLGTIVGPTPEPQGPGVGVGFRGLVVGRCGLFLRGVFLCLMCLAEPSVYAMW